MLPNITTWKLLSTSLDVLIWREALKNVLVKIIWKELERKVSLMWRTALVNLYLGLFNLQGHQIVLSLWPYEALLIQTRTANTLHIITCVGNDTCWHTLRSACVYTKIWNRGYTITSTKFKLDINRELYLVQWLQNDLSLQLYLNFNRKDVDNENLQVIFSISQYQIIYWVIVWEHILLQEVLITVLLRKVWQIA